MSNTDYSFPPGFLWGAATSAYQIEGSPLADGAGPNIWHRFSHTPGLTQDSATGDAACDHYNRWQQDLDLLSWLGLRAYRFSVAWARVLPEGTGRVNRKGLDFYDRLVDALLQRDILPLVTLYHWDLPATLDDRGGWLNRDVADWFAEFTSLVARTLGDRVAMWATLNEPWVVMDGGYMHGGLAPGHRNLFEAPIVTHNLLRAHGTSVQALRALVPQPVGLVVNIEPKYAASDSEADRTATQRADAYMNRQYLDPALLGTYPDELREMFGEAWPEMPDDDMALIRQPLDFIGINYYTRAVTCNDPTEVPTRSTRVAQSQHISTEMGWEVYPPGLTDTLTWFKARYGNVPVYVTENGAAFADPPSVNTTTLDDPLRVAYFRDHLRAVHRAISADVDVRGYFAWSLLDNFEWSHGYSKRFGIVHVDFATQQRTPKRSASFYRDVVHSNGRALADD
jgi:beta-glucosidase